MKKIILALLVIHLFSCQDGSKPAENVVTKADTLISPALARSMEQAIALDSLVIVADAKGNITMGNQALSLEQLETKLADTLQFMQKTYGKTPDTILYRSKGEVLMGTRGAIRDAIEDAKKKVIEKH